MNSGKEARDPRWMDAGGWRVPAGKKPEAPGASTGPDPPASLPGALGSPGSKLSSTVALLPLPASPVPPTHLHLPLCCLPFVLSKQSQDSERHKSWGVKMEARQKARLGRGVRLAGGEAIGNED